MAKKMPSQMGTLFNVMAETCPVLPKVHSSRNLTTMSNSQWERFHKECPFAVRSTETVEKIYSVLLIELLHRCCVLGASKKLSDPVRTQTLVRKNSYHTSTEVEDVTAVDFSGARVTTLQQQHAAPSSAAGSALPVERT